MQALSILFGAVFTVAVCLAIGSRMLGFRSDPGVRFVVGGVVLSMATFAMGVAGLLYPWIFGVALIWLWRCWDRPGKIEWRGRPLLQYLLFLVVAFYFVAYLFNAMAPESSFDGSAYHLSFVARYLRDHAIHPIRWNFYASLSQGAEMLYLVAFSFGQHSAASMIHFAFLLALTWQIFAYGRRIGYAIPGACAALLVFVSPMAGVDGTSAYVDVALAAVIFTLFHLLEIWDGERTAAMLVAVGLVAGFAYGVKYTGWIAVPFALVWVAWKSRRVRDVAIVAGAAAIMVLPWMIRNAIWVQNPLAPFFNHWFPNRYVTAAFEADYLQHYRHYDVANLWQLPMQVTTYGHLGGLLGPVFLLAPIGLIALRRAEGRRLLLAAAVFGASYYFSNISPRFLLPALPFVALAMCIALASVPRVAVALVLIHAIISWPTRLALYAAPDAWHLSKVPFRQALRIKSEDEYLDKNMFFYDVARMIDRSTPADATVFTYRPIPEAYTSRRILVNYESEPNQVAGKMIQAASFPAEAPALHISFRFPAQEIAEIRLSTVSSGHVQWRIHEIEVAAETQSPAADGNLLTFWRSPEYMEAGQHFELAVTPARLDHLSILTSLDQREVKLKLEGRDRSGGWHLLSDAPEVRDGDAGGDLRPAAVEQLRLRGIRYLLSFENEAETRDLREHTAEWGIHEVARNKDARLYQIP